MPIPHKYPLPAILDGIATVSQYDKWLNNKADTLRKGDLKMKRPFALKCSKAVYKQKIHVAIVNSDGKDPFTGDVLEFEICSWIVNESKSVMDPDEYIALCKKVTEHRTRVSCIKS